MLDVLLHIMLSTFWHAFFFLWWDESFFSSRKFILPYFCIFQGMAQVVKVYMEASLLVNLFLFTFKLCQNSEFNIKLSNPLHLMWDIILILFLSVKIFLINFCLFLIYSVFFQKNFMYFINSIFLLSKKSPIL